MKMMLYNHPVEICIKRVNWWHISKLTNVNPLNFLSKRKPKPKSKIA